MLNLTSYLVSQGISGQNLSYLLLAPLIATLIVFLRQIIGVRSLGIYHPLLLSFAFLSLGIESGLILFFTVAILANLTAYIIKRIALLYFPKITIIVTTVILSLLGVLFLIQFSPHYLNINRFLGVVIILSLSDKLVSAQVKSSLKPTLFLLLNTLITAVTGFYLLSSQWLQEVVLRYPIIYLLLILVINLFLGRFRGLRITEFWRFRHLLSHSSKS